VAAGGFGLRETIIRVNALSTRWGYEDIAMAAKSGADALLLPKVESADAIRHMEAIMRANGAPKSMKIWAMMETPRSVLESQRIAESTSRMECLVMGTSDLAKELDCAHTHERLPFMVSLGLCLLAARAAGLTILDGVYLDLNDEAGFEFACRQGQELGFDGKTLIHPKQVGPCNKVFTPKPEDVAWSRRIIEAHTAAAARGEGVVVVEGKLVENLHVESAHRVVDMAEAITKMEASH
jgi:citrate lyase subunit beta/citryl-CoA lyase